VSARIGKERGKWSACASRIPDTAFMHIVVVEKDSGRGASVRDTSQSNRGKRRSVMVGLLQ
jgi:hypothetical protein